MFEINEPLWLWSIVLLGNITIFTYNLPQVIHTVKTKSVKDISSIFLWLRVLAALLWGFYSAYKNEIDVLISWILTGGSSCILLFFKYKFHYQDKNKSLEMVVIK